MSYNELKESRLHYWRRKWQPTPVFLPGESRGQRILDGLLSMGSYRVRHNWSDLACMHVLEKEMAAHSSILAWRIPGTEDPGGLPSMGLHRVGHDWSNLAAAAATIWGRNISFYECKNGDSEVQLMCFIHAKRLQDGIWTQVCLVPEPSFCSWSFALSYYAKS